MASTADHETDIAIVGGGIAGVCLAYGLIKHPNIKVTVYEAAHSFHEIGGGVTVGPNASHAFDLLGPEVIGAISHLFTTNQDPNERETFFNFRLGQPVPTSHLKDADQVAKVTCKGGQNAVHRARLLDQLVELLPKDIALFGKRLVHMEDLGKTKGYRLLFRDGTESRHHIVLGCDGIKSVVRRYILGDENPAAHATFSHRYIHRGVIPMEKAIEAVGEKLATNPNVYMGRGGYVNTLPINNGQALNMGLFVSAATWDHEEWIVPASQFENDIHEEYKDFGPTVQKLIPLMENTDVWALFDTADYPASTYYKRHCAIMGDAAHASTPSQGSGAAMAVEDAYVLSELIANALENKIDVEKALRAYEMVRKPRTQLLVETSREAGNTWSMERRGIGEDLEKIKATAEERWKWIFEEKLEDEVVMGKRFLGAAM